MSKVHYKNDNGESVTFKKMGIYVLQSIDANSLGSTPISYSAIGQDGQNTDAVLLNPRTITCTVVFNGSRWQKGVPSRGRHDYSLMRSRWQFLGKCLNPKVYGTLTYENDNGIFKIRCRPDSVPNFEDFCGSYKTVKIDFIADDPYWKASESILRKVTYVSDGKNYPKTYPISYGILSETVTLNNDTGMPLPFTLEIETVEGCTFTVKNTTTGKAISTKWTMPEPLQLKIDTSNCQIRKKSAINPTARWEDASNLFLFSSDFDMVLAPGENVFTVQYSGGRPIVACEYHKLYLVV